MPEPNHVQPALDAVRLLKKEIKKRGGKEGGHLNNELLGYLATIEATLMQVVPVQSMLQIINQQSQLATNTIRSMSRFLPAATDENNGDDDGTSDTKGR